MLKYIFRFLFDRDAPPQLDGNLGYGAFESKKEIEEIVSSGGWGLALYEVPHIISHWSDDDLRIFYTWMDIKCQIQFTDQKIDDCEIEEWVDIFLDKHGLERMLFLEEAAKIYMNEMNDIDSFNAYNSFVEAQQRELSKREASNE